MSHELINVAWKTMVFYIMLLALLRVTGKREVASLNAIDLVGFIMISEAAIISIADGKIPFPVGATPVILLGGLEWIFAYLSLKDQRVRALVEGQPSVLVAHGKIHQQTLRKLRYNIGDLMAELRAKNVSNLADVEFAVLETTGKLSVVPRAGARPATPDDLKTLGVSQADPASTLPKTELQATVVLDGQLDEDALRRAGKDQAWLEDEIRKQGHDGGLAGILVAAVDGGGQLTVQKRDPGVSDPHAGDALAATEGPPGLPDAMKAGATEPEARKAANAADGPEGPGG